MIRNSFPLLLGAFFAVFFSSTTHAQIAVFKALDKVTGKTFLLEIPVKSSATLGPLNVHVQSCFSTPPEEPPETKVFLEVEETINSQQRRLFSGWMFASSPGLNGLEHPVYDLWSISCKMESGELFTGNE
ncbi:MAG: DUF2155 domain-containing protein [Parvibaculales bacterium]